MRTMATGEQSAASPVDPDQPVIPVPRDSALAFTEGVRGGWIASDLRAWINDHLIVPGRLALRRSHSLRVLEPGVGVVTLDAGRLPPSATPTELAILTVALVTAARERVIKALRASVESGQSSYINAALYTGRVSRERGADGRSSWYVFVTDDIALSDQVLALFAADALTNPAQYESELCVCDECGSVSFVPASGSRRGCPIHPFGSYEAGRPPSSQSGARRITERS